MGDTSGNADGFTFYFGASSRISRKALRELHEPNVMLNYATKMNRPWGGIEQLFIDSGGYSFMKGKGEYGTSDGKYLDFIEKHGPDLYALRDYPCEPDVLNDHDRTVEDHQRRTLERHVSLLNKHEDRRLDERPLSVVQGWRRSDYLDHIEQLRDHGAVTDYVGIGSVCRRNQAPEIRRIILAVRDALPATTDLHAFGVKGSVLRFREVAEALDSVDSAAYDWSQSRVPSQRSDGESFTWRDSARAYLNWRHQLEQTMGSESYHNRQQQLTVAADGGTNPNHDHNP